MLHRYVGRRGVVLLSLASVWSLFGLSIATYAPPVGSSGRFGIAFADHQTWALLWLVCGVVAAVCAVGRRWGWNDTIGWAAGVTPPIVWSALYAISYLWHLTTSGEVGNERAWVGVVSWGLTVGLIRVIAGWEDGLLEQPRPVAEEAA